MCVCHSCILDLDIFIERLFTIYFYVSPQRLEIDALALIPEGQTIISDFVDDKCLVGGDCIGVTLVAETGE